MRKSDEKALLALIALIFTGGLFLIYFVFKGLWELLTIPQKKKKEEEKRKYLLEKYNDAVLVSKLMGQTIWVDQTAEQVIDSIGYPEDTDQKVLKTKKKEVWKYYHRGGNRYGLRITLDNDVVVGWDEKM